MAYAGHVIIIIGFLTQNTSNLLLNQKPLSLLGLSFLLFLHGSNFRSRGGGI